MNRASSPRKTVSFLIRCVCVCVEIVSLCSCLRKILLLVVKLSHRIWSLKQSKETVLFTRHWFLYFLSHRSLSPCTKSALCRRFFSLSLSLFSLSRCDTSFGSVTQAWTHTHARAHSTPTSALFLVYLSLSSCFSCRFFLFSCCCSITVVFLLVVHRLCWTHLYTCSFSEKNTHVFWCVCVCVSVYKYMYTYTDILLFSIVWSLDRICEKHDGK